MGEIDEGRERAQPWCCNACALPLYEAALGTYTRDKPCTNRKGRCPGTFSVLKQPSSAPMVRCCVFSKDGQKSTCLREIKVPDYCGPVRLRWYEQLYVHREFVNHQAAIPHERKPETVLEPPTRWDQVVAWASSVASTVSQGLIGAGTTSPSPQEKKSVASSTLDKRRRLAVAEDRPI